MGVTALQAPIQSPRWPFPQLHGKFYEHLTFGIVLLMASLFVHATELRVGQRYIVNGDFTVTYHNDPTKTVELKRENTFEIKKIDQNKVIIDVTGINKGQPDSLFDPFFVADTTQVDLNIYTREWDRIVHGLLVVPFKISFYDLSVSSQSVTLGYYLQGCRRITAGGIVHGPIISAGLSSITRSEKDNAELGFTFALGYIFTINNKFQVGVVAGIDHLGDDTWKQEDKGWASMMIGFNFLQKEN